MSTLKRLLVGKPLASSEEGHQRLGKLVALAVFASDAISSTAYATEEILHVLVPLGGLEALEFLIPIALIVVALLAIVITSYRQTIFAYPNGGGSYVVSRDNLGVTASLVAGASLLVDYTLTVAVSVSAGVAAITSAFPELRPNRVALCLGFIALLVAINLRGVKESGRLFAVPTYVYVVTLGALLLIGLVRSFTGSLPELEVNQHALDELTHGGALLTGITAMALMRAFSSGAVALSGIEAISNGVPSFRKPESKNAAITLVYMGLILAGFFFGISVLAHRLKPTIEEGGETLLSIMAGSVFGGGSAAYFTLQAATAAILILAANTAFNAFPSMSSILAKDGYLPRQLYNRGDRLVYSNGVLVLAGAAAVLVVAFGGITTALIPLYAVGVFTGFTLSQWGMVRHHLRHREPGWRRNIVVNAVGAVATFAVLAVVVVSKFTIGAWIPAVVIPLIVVLLRAVHRHYQRVAAVLAVPEGYRPLPHTHTVVVLVGNVHQGVLAALTYAKSLSPDRLIALSVVSNSEESEALREQWEQYHLDMELDLRYSPYRELTQPVLKYLDELDATYENDIITVVVPEFVLSRWWEQLLHNQSALLLKGRLLFRRNTVVTSVPFHISGPLGDDGPGVGFNERDEPATEVAGSSSFQIERNGRGQASQETGPAPSEPNRSRG
ncbi:MAG TPA: APC family permease [Acidimicrobiales bacterium]|nr:APC family permease [Acidimicrobiales bacterium]